MAKRIVIVAGEASGDLHGARLVEALKDLDPGIELYGLGGKRMQAAGVEISYDLTNLAVVGFVEVLKNLRKFKKIFSSLLERIDYCRPDAAILIDYPGFNLRLAKELKRRHIPIIYYISPQVWAWGKNRINLIGQLVDRMIVVFKFEQELYQKEGIEVFFCGHPLLDIVKSAFNKEQFLSELNIPSHLTNIALLPGSRRKEIERILPIMLEAAKIIHRELPKSFFSILKSSAVNKGFFTKLTSRYNFPFSIIEDRTYDGLNACDFALVASGTATLEAAILNRPMFIIYKVSFFSWLFLKFLIKIPYIGLVNVVAEKRVVPEYLQYNARPKIIAQETLRIMQDKDKIFQIKEGLQKVRGSLGSPGASQRAAENILQLLDNH